MAGSESEGLKYSFRIPSSHRETEPGLRREKKRRNSKSGEEGEEAIKRQRGEGRAGAWEELWRGGREVKRPPPPARPPSTACYSISRSKGHPNGYTEDIYQWMYNKSNMPM